MSLCGLGEYKMQVFGNHDFPPDAEFGCFQMVKGPPDTDFADEALLRLDVGKLSCHNLHAICFDDANMAQFTSNCTLMMLTTC